MSTSSGKAMLHDFTTLALVPGDLLGLAGYTFLDSQEVATLNSGYKIPLVGLGTWKAEKGGAVAEAVKTALRAGYRHIDCAAFYQNESEEQVQVRLYPLVALRSRNRFQAEGFNPLNTSHGTADVMPACRKTLEDLQLSYLDLYLVHWPVTGTTGDVLTPSYKETWQAMEALVDAKLVRSIGVSNLSIVKLKELLTYARIKPAANQIEAHPFFRNDDLIQFCKEQGIHVTAYSPLGSPDSASVVSRKYSPSLVKLPIVTKIAEKHHVDAGRVLIRWAVQRGTSVLPKSVNPGRIKSNVQVFDWSLDAEDMAALSGIKIQLRMVDGSVWLNPAGPYRTLAEVWDNPEEDKRGELFAASPYAKLPFLSSGSDIRLPAPRVRERRGTLLTEYRFRDSGDAIHAPANVRLMPASGAFELADAELATADIRRNPEAFYCSEFVAVERIPSGGPNEEAYKSSDSQYRTHTNAEASFVDPSFLSEASSTMVPLQPSHSPRQQLQSRSFTTTSCSTPSRSPF
eukprot:gene17517-23834_t